MKKLSMVVGGSYRGAAAVGSDSSSDDSDDGSESTDDDDSFDNAFSDDTVVTPELLIGKLIRVACENFECGFGERIFVGDTSVALFGISHCKNWRLHLWVRIYPEGLLSVCLVLLNISLLKWIDSFGMYSPLNRPLNINSPTKPAFPFSAYCSSYI